MNRLSAICRSKRVRDCSAVHLSFSSFSTRAIPHPPKPPKQIPEAHISPDEDPSKIQSAIAAALSPHYESQSPLVIRGAYAKSDAYYCWKSLDYLNVAVGPDTPCYVEIGGSYADSKVEKPEVSFGEYIRYMKKFEERYGNDEDTWPLDKSAKRAPPGEIVYLAQNDLPPALHNDFVLPQLCRDVAFAKQHRVGEGKIYSVMLWLGPRGTVSPLHYDPLDNLLIQMAGKKRVLLYPKTAGLAEMGAAEEAVWVYAGADGMQYNTSPVDVEEPSKSLVKYPLFANSPQGIVCTLDPGDLLFIPAKWWHHVRSLSRSVSVNAWWI